MGESIDFPQNYPISLELADDLLDAAIRFVLTILAEDELLSTRSTYLFAVVINEASALSSQLRFVVVPSQVPVKFTE